MSSLGTKPRTQANSALVFVIEKILVLFTVVVFHGIMLYGNSIYLFYNYRFTQILNYCVLQILVETVIKFFKMYNSVSRKLIRDFVEKLRLFFF